MAVVTTKELADSAGVTPGRVRQWVMEGMPRIARNQFDSEACLEWVAERREDKVAGQYTDIKPWRVRFLRLQGDNQEMKNAALAGSLVSKDTALAESKKKQIAALSVCEGTVRTELFES